MPGIHDVHFTSEKKKGVDAARHCTFDDGVELYERLEEPIHLSFRDADARIVHGHVQDIRPGRRALGHR